MQIVHSQRQTTAHLKLHYIKTRWLYCVECPQYRVRLEAHAVT